MRVAVFTDANLDAMNGATTTLRALMAHAARDVEPRIYTFSDLEIDEPRYRAIRGGLVGRLRSVRDEVLRDGIDVVHMTTAGPAGLVARYLAGHVGLPLVGSLHETVVPGRAVARARYLRWMFGRCAQLLVPSQEAARALAACGWSPDRTVVWPRGVDPGLFSPDHRSEHLRDAWHVSDRRPAILVAGQLSPEKGVALLEPLSSLLHRQRVAHRVIVLGSGPLLSALKDRCPHALFTGRLVPSEVPPVMASADVLLYPSDSPSGCTVLLEAQASGLPVVVAGAGSARENMLPGRTGFVSRPTDVEEFAVRLGLLLVDRGRRQAMGEAARAYACARSWESSLATVCAVYRGVRATSPVVNKRAPTLTRVPHHRSAGQR
jgi:glycosyltransferase involved in cell wall biosynthesis